MPVENQNLNKRQEAAAMHLNGPMMVLAGPGSGKTTVILHRIKNLITYYNVNPGGILVVTFTKASAEEMRARFKDISSGISRAGRVTISTFHSLFFRVISAQKGLNTDNVLKEEEKTAVLKALLAKEGIAPDEELVRGLMLEMSLIKNELIDIKYHNPFILGSDDFRRVYNAYETHKRKHNKLDFDDMMQGCYSLFKSNPAVLASWRRKYAYIMIDEFQDINRAQYECVKMLAEHKNLFIVGDDDQSIYRFRGASPEFLLNFPRDYPETQKVVLDVNYRSTDRIIGLCNKVIAGNEKRYQKGIGGTGKDGPAPRVLRTFDARAEALAVSGVIQDLTGRMGYNDIAVIYRNNIQSRAFIDIFLNLNIPFVIKDEAPGIYEHWAVKDLLAYFRLSQDINLKDEAVRIINKPSRYIGKELIKAAGRKSGSLLNNLYRAGNAQIWQRARVEDLIFRLSVLGKLKPHEGFKYIRTAIGYDTYIGDYASYRRFKPEGLLEILDELQDGAKGFDTIPAYIEHIQKAAAASKENRGDAPRGVMLTTLHSAKGLEFEAVFVISAVDGLIPYEKSKTEAEIEEERRLFYVGLTRAKSVLYISIVKNRHEKAVEPTVFLKGIIKDPAD